jgi:hypothetical protein
MIVCYTTMDCMANKCRDLLSCKESDKGDKFGTKCLNLVNKYLKYSDILRNLGKSDLLNYLNCNMIKLKQLAIMSLDKQLERELNE